MLAKWTPCFANEASIEAGLRIDPREQKAAVVVITDNLFAGRSGRDLKPVSQASCKIRKTAAAILVPYRPTSYGKTAPIVLNGKQEHGAVATTVRGNVMRVGGGKAWISSIIKLAAPGALSTFHPPARMRYVRCHYDGSKTASLDAPLPKRDRHIARLEIVVAPMMRLRARRGCER